MTQPKDKGKKIEKDFWIYHPAIGYYRPVGEKDGVPVIEVQQKVKLGGKGPFYTVEGASYLGEKDL